MLANFISFTGCEHDLDQHRHTLDHMVEPTRLVSLFTIRNQMIYSIVHSGTVVVQAMDEH